MEQLYSLRFKEILRSFQRQPASFLLVCLYLLFEYVRPQSIYTALAGPPYALISIIAAGVAVLSEHKSSRAHLGTTLLLLFAGVVLASSITAYDPGRSFGNLELFLSWLLIYILIIMAIDTRERFFGFFLTFLLYSFKMSQHGARSWVGAGFGYRKWGVTGAPGWFENSGEFGIQMCIFLPLAIYFLVSLWKHWPTWKRAAVALLPLTAGLSAMGSSSRGTQIGLAAVAAWMFAKSKYRVRAAVVVVALIIFIPMILPPEQTARFTSMGTDYTSRTRMQYWKDGLVIAQENPLLGIGYFNWLPYYRNFYNPVGELPHNIFIQCMTELGYTGLLVFVALILATLVINYRTRRLAKLLSDGGGFEFHIAHGLDAALIGYLASGFFVTVLYYPFFWINLALTVSLNLVTMRAVREQVRIPGAAPGPVAVRPMSGWRVKQAVARVPRARPSGT